MATEAEVRDFLLRVKPSNAAAVGFLQLCEVAYLPQDEIKATIENPLLLPPITPGGRWQCVWGPAQDDDTANLAFVALYRAEATAAPLFGAVTIRGTDAHIDDAWASCRNSGRTWTSSTARRCHGRPTIPPASPAAPWTH